MTGSSIASSAAAVVPGALCAAPPALNPPEPPLAGRGDGGASGPPAGLVSRPVAFGPLRGVYGKELRENAKYAVFLFLALALATFFVVWTETLAFDRPLHEDSVLFNAVLQMLSAFACPVAALLLANFQTFSERSSDLRAFTLHRAMTPTRLFATKCLAGLCLYAVVIGVPDFILMGYAAWARRGGLLFDWRFARPYAADFVMGLVYYFAGFLVAQRQARWYVSRVFPIPAAIGASICTLGLPQFWQAMAANLGFAAIFGIAAWHNFVRNGVDAGMGMNSEPSPMNGSAGRRLARFAGRGALPIVMGMGLTMTLGGLLWVADLALDSWIGVHAGWYMKSGDIGDYKPTMTRAEFDDYFLLPNGLPALVKSDNQYSVETGWHDTRQYFDLQDNPLAAAATQPAFASGIGRTFYPHRDVSSVSYRDAKSVIRVIEEGDTSDDPKNWLAQRWLYVKPWGYYAGYIRPTGQMIGTIGRTGFLPLGASPQPFAPSFLDNSFSGDQWIEINPSDLKHPVYIRFTTPNGEAIRGVGSVTVADTITRQYVEGHLYGVWLLVLTDKHLYLLNYPYHTVTTSFPVEYPPEQCTIVVQSCISGRIALRYIPNTFRDTQYLSLYTDEGKLLNRVTLPALPPGKIKYRQPGDAEITGIRAMGLVDAFRNPVVLDVAQRVYDYSTGHDYLIGHETNGSGVMIFRSLAGWNADPPWVGSLYREGIALPMILAAGVTFWLTRRYRFTVMGTCGWTMVGLLMGPVGLLTFLFTQPLAARVACGSCGKKRVVTRETCEHCGAAFEKPARNGTEVFE